MDLSSMQGKQLSHTRRARSPYSASGYRPTWRPKLMKRHSASTKRWLTATGKSGRTALG